MTVILVRADNGGQPARGAKGGIVPRYNLRLCVVENGSFVERTVSIEASSHDRARKIALDLYGEVVIVAIGPERFLEHRQRRFSWSEKHLEDGTYAAVAFIPVGPGARNGTATHWKPTREAHFPTRSAAIKCARKWYEEARAKDARAEGAHEQDLQETPESLAASALLNPSFGACKNCGGQLHVDRGEGGERLMVCSGEDAGASQPGSMEARLARGCGQVFPLLQRGTLRPTGKTCTCGWPLVEIVPAYVDSSPWVQCVDTDCTKLRDEWWARGAGLE